MTVRIPAIDNGKAFLIILVIFGHLLETQIFSLPIVRAIYLAIYSFTCHSLPTYQVRFIGEISHCQIGLQEILGFSGSSLSAKYFTKTTFFSLFHKPSLYLKAFQPYGLLWYLWSLPLWRLASMFTKNSQSIIAVAFGAGCLIGLFDQDLLVLGLSRTVVFFPFFLLGSRFGFDALSRSASTAQKWSAAFILIGVVVASFLALDINVGWLYGAESYKRLGVQVWYVGCFARIGFYVTATLASFAILVFLPRGDVPIGSSCGSKSLTIYVWHGLILLVLKDLIFLPAVTVTSELTFVFFSLIISISLAWLLSRDVVARITKRITKGS